MINNLSAWFARPQISANSKIRLFCFPYAGSGAHLFSGWLKFMPPEIEICAAQMPGRGIRIDEPPFKDVDDVVPVFAAEILKLADKPFALFGHSLGAVIAFETARYLKKTADLSPVHLFVSGRIAPQTPETREKIHHLPDDEFIESLKRMGGTPEQLFENKELMELILPAVRADFQMVETYRYEPSEFLRYPITAFGGLSDPLVSRENLCAWESLTKGKFTAHFLAGDHFFVNIEGQRISAEIAAHLL